MAGSRDFALLFIDGGYEPCPSLCSAVLWPCLVLLCREIPVGQIMWMIAAGHGCSSVEEEVVFNGVPGWNLPLPCLSLFRALEEWVRPIMGCLFQNHTKFFKVTGFSLKGCCVILKWSFGSRYFHTTWKNLQTQLIEMNVTPIALRSVHFYFAQIISIVECRKLKFILYLNICKLCLECCFIFEFLWGLGWSHPRRDYCHWQSWRTSPRIVCLSH